MEYKLYIEEKLLSLHCDITDIKLRLDKIEKQMEVQK